MRTQTSLPQTSSPSDSSEWRDEVSDRLKAHRARRQPAATTLALNFEGDGGHSPYLDPHEELKRVRAARRDAAREQMTKTTLEFPNEAQSEAEAGAPEPQIQEPAEVLAHHSGVPDHLEAEPGVSESFTDAGFSFSNIIEFPGRILAARARRSEAKAGIAAEESQGSVAAQLRIFEADHMEAGATPEPPIPPTGWAGLHLDDDKPAKPEASPEFELPLQVAPIGKRAACVAADSALVLLGCAVFSVMEFSVANCLPVGRNLALFVAVPSMLLWVIYHAMFLVLGKATPGMRCTALGICNFEDDHATRGQRLARVFACLLSLVSLGMGYLWVSFDEDGIGWHDRMTRTYLREL